ncbi:AAA family ATPase [Anaerobiospirillum thomasii]|uniref:Predicted AAA-ATPase n=1 Tax=Anaerobiospirillum thomasii TaxID=179995 RepID=A0A2X0V8M9_9GAMM|nr:AAA family ATPase [Anaerobiospirillum thomasii]SPT70824.1 Predicted AAA-ATPase [Anaerobiospirillum thomasii]
MDINDMISVLPGCESFEKLIESNAYYVDKTSFLKTLFYSPKGVENALFTRPRRFGKTLNMSMIKAFCELDYKNPGDTTYQQKLFIDNGRNLAVSQDEYKELRDKVMGQLPVIYVSFRGVEGLCFHQAVDKIITKIALLYKYFLFLADSKKIPQAQKDLFLSIYNFCFKHKGELKNDALLDKAISYCGTFIPTLADMLYTEYDRQVLILIDEYDVPLQKAVVAEKPYYEKMLAIIRDISVNTFKQDPDAWLYKGIITGCLKIAHQSVFTDANNFTTFNVNSKLYSSFFGFTQEETDKILCDFGVESKRDEIKKWYNGYRFGHENVYCPWSLMEYCLSVTDGSEEPEAYWVNTSGNDIITLFTKNSIEANDGDNIQKLQDLMDGKSVLIKLSEFSVYPDIKQGMSFDTFCTMMLQTGYVTFDENSKLKGMVSVKIPNHEVRQAFETKFSCLYSNDNDVWKDEGFKLLDALMSNDIDKAQAIINAVLATYISIRHSGSEQYYHGLMQGLLVYVARSKRIRVLDESERGLGYSDIILDDYKNKRVVILEFKKATGHVKNCIKVANEALEQIRAKNYATPYLDYYEQIYGIGIGFYQKSCEIVSLGNIAKQVRSD